MSSNFEYAYRSFELSSNLYEQQDRRQLGPWMIVWSTDGPPTSIAQLSSATCERNRYLPSLGHCIWETSLLQILSCTLTNIPPCLVLKRQPGFLYHLLCLNLNLFTHFDGAQMSVWEIISLVLFVHLWEYLYLTSCWMNSFNRHGILLGKQFPFRVWSYCPIFFVILEKVCFDLWMFCSSYWGFRILFHLSVRFWIFSVLYCGANPFLSIVFGPQWSLSICSLILENFLGLFNGWFSAIFSVLTFLYCYFLNVELPRLLLFS